MVAILLLQAPDTGRIIEYSPFFRFDDNERFEKVKKVLDGESSDPKQISLQPGMPSLFRSHSSIHDVTEVKGLAQRTRLFSVIPPSLISQGP